MLKNETIMFNISRGDIQLAKFIRFFVPMFVTCDLITSGEIINR